MSNKCVIFFMVMTVAFAMALARPVSVVQTTEHKVKISSEYGAEILSDATSSLTDKTTTKVAYHSKHMDAGCCKADGTLYCCDEAPTGCDWEKGLCNYTDSPCVGR
ncbi:hypothetical protein Mapa_010705 [Marchantia paleacea]|nr:hypothetical protein Mapa_010705 [Marchantia paleacea]